MARNLTPEEDKSIANLTRLLDIVFPVSGEEASLAFDELEASVYDMGQTIVHLTS